MNKVKTLIASQIQIHRKALADWYAQLAAEAPPPFYCSIDLRDSGYKIAPVDCNLYPAGFNNICPEDHRTSPSVIKNQIAALFPKAGPHAVKVLVLPEANTRNIFYLENLYYLRQILLDAGLEAQLGWWGPPPEGSNLPLHLQSESGKELILEQISIAGDGTMAAGGFIPDLILLNNDFSGGHPRELDNVKQPIIPSHLMGWHSRKKSTHFKHYNLLAEQFARIIQVDPWLVRVETEEVDQVNFNEDLGIDRVAASAERILNRMKEGFTAHGVKRKPFVFIKNDAGTYGMGIMVVHDAAELRQMNRRTKNKMSVGKNKSQIESLCVQEGIPTATLVDRLAAEPVIYLCGPELIGGFLRTNTEKGEEDNLNSQGMVFRKLCMADLRDMEHDETVPNLPILELVYGSIARLSAFAAGRELAELVER